MSNKKTIQTENKLANTHKPGFTEETAALAHNYFILCAYERMDIAICNDLFEKLERKYTAGESGIDYLASQIHTINNELKSIKEQKDYIQAYLTNKLHDKGREYFLETLVHNYSVACKAQNCFGPTFQDLASAFSDFFDATKPTEDGRDVIEGIKNRIRSQEAEMIKC